MSIDSSENGFRYSGIIEGHEFGPRLKEYGMKES